MGSCCMYGASPGRGYRPRVPAFHGVASCRALTKLTFQVILKWDLLYNLMMRTAWSVLLGSHDGCTLSAD